MEFDKTPLSLNDGFTALERPISGPIAITKGLPAPRGRKS